MARASEATTELQRFEFALLGRLIGRPVVQIVHGEGSRKDQMDSLIRRFWYLNLANERIALTAGEPDRLRQRQHHRALPPDRAALLSPSRNS